MTNWDTSSFPKITAGDHVQETLGIQKDGSDFTDLTNWDVTVTVYGDPDDTPDLVLTSSGSGIDMTVGNSHEFDVIMTTSETSNLNTGAGERTYQYEIEITSGTDTRTVARGRLLVRPDVG